MSKCPICNMPETRREGSFLFCMQGHMRDTSPTPIRVTHMFTPLDEPGIRYNRKHQICTNCHREKHIQRKGLCWKCSGLVKGFAVGSPEYIAGLKKALAEINDPDFRKHRNSKNRKKKEGL